LKIDLEKHVLGNPCRRDEHQVLGLTWRYMKGEGSCVECAKAWHAAYRKANSEKEMARHVAYREANPEKEMVRQAAYRKTNLEKEKAQQAAYRKANPEKVSARYAAYRKANSDRINARCANRRAAQLQRTPPWADLKDIEGFYQTAAKFGFHVDHHVPLQGKLVSGLHVSNNLRMIPAEDNTRKGNRFDPWTHVHELPSPQPA
jgi:hypothetical protein